MKNWTYVLLCLMPFVLAFEGSLLIVSDPAGSAIEKEMLAIVRGIDLSLYIPQNTKITFWSDLDQRTKEKHIAAFGLQTTPQILLIEKDQLVWRINGYQNQAQLIEKLTEKKNQKNDETSDAINEIDQIGLLLDQRKYDLAFGKIGPAFDRISDYSDAQKWELLVPFFRRLSQRELPFEYWEKCLILSERILPNSLPSHLQAEIFAVQFMGYRMQGLMDKAVMAGLQLIKKTPDEPGLLILVCEVAMSAGKNNVILSNSQTLIRLAGKEMPVMAQRCYQYLFAIYSHLPEVDKKEIRSQLSDIDLKSWSIQLLDELAWSAYEYEVAMDIALNWMTFCLENDPEQRVHHGEIYARLKYQMGFRDEAKSWLQLLLNGLKENEDKNSLNQLLLAWEQDKD